MFNTGDLFYFALGLVVLIGGAELFVRGASRLAALLGIPPLIIGLTVVAFGTSSPELAVSIQSALSAQADLAVGNVVGSNVFNILFILGISAALVPLRVAVRLIHIDVPLMIFISAVFYLIALDGGINRIEGLLLIAGLAGYLFLTIRLSKDSKGSEDEFEQELSRDKSGIWRSVFLVVIGLAALLIGSSWLIEGAISIARAMEISELIIALTLVAAGTSLPEVATSVIAAIRSERDIAVGNVVGSNIFNLLAVVGLASIFSSGGLAVNSQAIYFDIPVMLAASIACLPIFFTGHLIARWEGFSFLAYYCFYLLYLILFSTGANEMALFKLVMWFFVIPLTILTLAIFSFRALRKRLSTRSR